MAQFGMKATAQSTLWHADVFMHLLNQFSSIKTGLCCQGILGKELTRRVKFCVLKAVPQIDIKSVLSHNSLLQTAWLKLRLVLAVC